MIQIIYCILGMSGTGKSTIAREVSKRLNIPLVISYTSRPIRPNEQKGVDYHYVDNKHFDDNFDDFIEMREYTVFDGSVWKYGYKKSDLNSENSDYLVVIDPGGFFSFEQYFGKNAITPLLVISNVDDIMARINRRGDNPKEIERRISDDFARFEKFKKDVDCERIYNMYELDYAINQVISKIKKGE